MAHKDKNDYSSPSKSLEFYPPVVTVLGHVDHGKTTLLDAMRKTDIAQKEHGGITQRIGASQVEIEEEGKKKAITFIDTPGHEIFIKMRSRGAQVADLALLIVSATEGIKPQTKEIIEILKQANIPYIVVLTKIDLPEKIVEKIKQQLLKEGIMLEGLGGDVPFIEVSAKTGTNIKELLDLILLVYELNEDLYKDKSKEKMAEGVVIESKLDYKSGPRSTIVVKQGTFGLRDKLYCEGIEGRVRTLIDDRGRHVEKVSVGDAVELLGFEKVPNVGGRVFKKEELELIKDNAFQKSDMPSESNAPYNPHAKKEGLSLLLCADTAGSLEAITSALPEEINIVFQKTGDISESDILFAKSVHALVIGFNTKTRQEVLNLANQENVLIKNYTIIYELIDEITDVMEGKKIALEEKIFGTARVLAKFPFEKTWVMGVVVIEGRIARGDKARVMRKDIIIGEGILNSLRHGKDTVSKIDKGNEGGVVISPFLDFTIGDVLICHS